MNLGPKHFGPWELLMPDTADFLRFFMATSTVSMALLAVFFLRTRQLSSWAYLSCSLLIVLLPLLGPFLVILLHPGRSRIRRGSQAWQRLRPVPEAMFYLAGRWLQKLRLR